MYHSSFIHSPPEGNLIKVDSKFRQLQIKHLLCRFLCRYTFSTSLGKYQGVQLCMIYSFNKSMFKFYKKSPNCPPMSVHGNFLVVQWLGLGTLLLPGPWFWYLVKEHRSHKLHSEIKYTHTHTHTTKSVHHFAFSPATNKSSYCSHLLWYYQCSGFQLF